MAGAKAEAVHTSKIADDQLFAAAKRKIWKFILAVVDNKLVYELRELITFYTSVEPSDLLDNLEK